MAKLFKHLGLGGGKRGAGSSSSPQCDRVRLLFPEQTSPPGRGSPLTIPSILGIGDVETDSSAASTISSANRSTVGSEDFPNPPSSWLNSSNASMIVSSNSSCTFVVDHNGNGSKEQTKSKMANIYENQEVFVQPENSKLFNEDCWNEVKLWLQEMSNPSSLSSTHQPTQSDIDNARFLAEILSALQRARSEIFPNDLEGRPLPILQTSVQGENNQTGARVGNMLSEVVMKLESEYERARKSLTSKDYERYTRLKELLKFEIQEPIYGLQEFKARPTDISELESQTAPMVESCFYDEPWNSDDVHVELEDQFHVTRAMAPGSGNNNGAVTSGNSVTEFQFLQAPQSNSSSPHDIDARTRTGYEPPWDWKPHQKDGRKEEGYDKPWDLKPHCKDNRPNKEYEEPWDHKGLRVESDLMAAKMAKEARESGLAEAEGGQQLQKKYKDHKLPAKDYEDPWDQKTKEIECDLIAAKIAKVTARIGMPTIISKKPEMIAQDANSKVVLAVSEPTSTSGDNQMKKKKVPTAVSPAQQQSTQPSQTHSNQQFFSPFKKPLPPLPPSSSHSPLLNQADSPRMKASSDATGIPNAPQTFLNDNIWYHGAIGRSEAENLLQKHREASFLVRKSENTPNDYSLSVRSNKGFMHLKIVTDPNGKFILGQFSQPFTSIPQMVQYYTSSKLPIKGAEHTSLHHPVPRNSP